MKQGRGRRLQIAWESDRQSIANGFDGIEPSYKNDKDRIDRTDLRGGVWGFVSKYCFESSVNAWQYLGSICVLVD